MGIRGASSVEGASQGRARPFEQTFWVVEGKLLAGCYPAAPKLAEGESKLDILVQCGVGCVVNLVVEGEHNYNGQVLRPYADLLERATRVQGTTADLCANADPRPGGAAVGNHGTDPGHRGRGDGTGSDSVHAL